MESQKKVTSSYVVVIGLGGVGSHAASMLLRSGVGRLLLVDFDQVSSSSDMILACSYSYCAQPPFLLVWNWSTLGAMISSSLIIMCMGILALPFNSCPCSFGRLCEKVSVSSLNRHAVATRDDVGIPKAHCLKKHFSLIFPESCIDAKVLLYDISSEAEILSGNPDFVLDCIDNIDTKVFLSLLIFLLTQFVNSSVHHFVFIVIIA